MPWTGERVDVGLFGRLCCEAICAPSPDGVVGVGALPSRTFIKREGFFVIGDLLDGLALYIRGTLSG